MPSASIKKEIPCSKENLIKMVLDIEKYPEFVPWCLGSKIYKKDDKGDKIEIAQGERHRIIGTDEYAVVAEIWIHTDKDNPSDEDDIVRIQDDFNRN